MTTPLTLRDPSGRWTLRLQDPQSKTIGRSQPAQLVVPEPELAKEHARVFGVGDHWYIETVNASAFVTVNNEPVREPTEFKQGDRIGLTGHVVFDVVGD